MEFSDLFSPEYLLRNGGFSLLLLIVYAETGLMAGFFLPGDSLLFTAGLLAGIGFFPLSPPILVLLVCLAAIAGDQTGYWFGRRVGPPLFKREDSFIFKKRYLEMAKDFYDRNGTFALIMGKFLPIFRTFVPIFAGVVKMDFRRYLFIDVSGVLIWVNVMMWSGFFLGRFEVVKNNLEWVIVGLIVLTTIPIIRTFLSERNRARDNRDTEN